MAHENRDDDEDDCDSFIALLIYLPSPLVIRHVYGRKASRSSLEGDIYEAPPNFDECVCCMFDRMMLGQMRSLDDDDA